MPIDCLLVSLVLLLLSLLLLSLLRIILCPERLIVLLDLGRPSCEIQHMSPAALGADAAEESHGSTTDRCHRFDIDSSYFSIVNQP